MNIPLHHNMSTVIHKYADSVLKVMKLYYSRIENMNNIHDLFKGNLGKYRRHVYASCVPVLRIFFAYDVNMITLQESLNNSMDLNKTTITFHHKSL